MSNSWAPLGSSPDGPYWLRVSYVWNQAQVPESQMARSQMAGSRFQVDPKLCSLENRFCLGKLFLEKGVRGVPKTLQTLKLSAWYPKALPGQASFPPSPTLKKMLKVFLLFREILLGSPGGFLLILGGFLLTLASFPIQCSCYPNLYKS